MQETRQAQSSRTGSRERKAGRLFTPAVAMIACMTLSTIAHAGEPYASMLKELCAEITSSLPQIDEASRKSIVEAKDAEARAEAVKQVPGLDAFLASDALDVKLAKCFILQDGTPAGLAAYVQQGATQKKLIDFLLANDKLMVQIAVADGAQPVQASNARSGAGQYGKAMEIYLAIQQASPKARKGVLQRLALAVSLELSERIRKPQPDAPADAPREIDPVKRYLHFEEAYETGELDPKFDRFSTWDLRFVVCAPEPDEALAWGREMLRNFRPDHVYTQNEPWRYVNVVNTDVAYGSYNTRYDRPEFWGPQNILMNGGICGRRAFFARYICRAFGVPATARPSSGHGASAKWSTKGWIVVLGPGWRHGWTGTRYRTGLDFPEHTQARALGDDFLKVKRAWWVGDAMGEARVYGEHSKRRPPEFWNGVALATQKRLVEAAGAETLDAIGVEFSEASGTTLLEQIAASEVSPEDRQVTYGSGGTITIPAAAYTKPSGNTSDVVAMKSFAGGLQVFLPRFNQQQPIMVRGGSYKHEASLCESATRHWKGRRPKHSWHLRGLRLAVTPNGDERPKELTLELADAPSTALGASVTMAFVYIEPGTFIMGGEREDISEGRVALADTPKHEVTLTEGFYLGKYEMTQAQYEAVMDKSPGKGGRGPNYPVDSVKPSRALILCDKLSASTGLDVRIPSEAEWEYAARVGTESRWFFGDDPSKLGEYAWFKDNAEDKSHPVGMKKPNPWGLYDIYGNICEFVRDEHNEDYYANSPKLDPVGPLMGIYSSMEYSINVPKAGTYNLSALVVTKNVDQSMQLSVNESEATINLPLPFTIGMWEESAPVTVTLQEGANALHVWRDQAPQAGMAVKSFTLKPVDG